jgi:hypothetical protein
MDQLKLLRGCERLRETKLNKEPTVQGKNKELVAAPKP